jgi:hypothetical protein
MENPIERVLASDDESFLTIRAGSDEETFIVALYGRGEEKAEEIVEMTGETIAEAMTKLEEYITKRVDYAYGNAFWQDVEDEKEDDAAREDS